MDAATGALAWQPTAEQAGEYELELTVSSPTGSDSQRLRVQVECRAASLGVGCTAAPGGLAWALLAGLAAARRRRARGR